MMNASALTVRINTEDLEVLRTLFGTESPAPATRAKLDGIAEAEVEFIDLSRRHGMTGEDIVITVVINLATGVPASLLAAWIFQHLTQAGKQPVEIGRDTIVKSTEAEILEYFTKVEEVGPSDRT